MLHLNKLGAYWAFDIIVIWSLLLCACRLWNHQRKWEKLLPKTFYALIFLPSFRWIFRVKMVNLWLFLSEWLSCHLRWKLFSLALGIAQANWGMGILSIFEKISVNIWFSPILSKLWLSSGSFIYWSSDLYATCTARVFSTYPSYHILKIKRVKTYAVAKIRTHDLLVLVVTLIWWWLGLFLMSSVGL